VLSLVIADDPTPRLDCPLCGRRFTQCSIGVSSQGAECPFCRQTFPLWSPTPPPELTVSEQDGNWQIAISQRSPHALGVKLFGISAPILIVGDALTRVSERASDDPFAPIQRMVTVLLVALAVAAIGTAANWLLGRHAIDGKSLALDRVNGVVLTKVTRDDGEARHVIRLEGVGFHKDLGETLSPAQRTWVALFLLRKAAEVACVS
jgi:hypothetical protein